ncbi:MAG: NAD(P)H-binding protein [Thermodesulfovibrionales bacterium]|nr:NAD(P)H-binding protein [Thermodesulfovibrionales bacterium]
MNIAILGAPGCVGRNLIKKLLETPDYTVTASYRVQEEIASDIHDDRLVWKKVNLLDPLSAGQFLSDADVLIYLIHSLGAKHFEELDIQLANAAGTAAKKAGLKKIIYLGGIVPEDREASPHLTSRVKTGQALASHGIPVAEVRASILLETCSASYLIVYFLARRLPVMITPLWLNSLCAPIALTDAASCLAALVQKEIRGHEIFEIGSEVIRYRDLLSLCGKAIRGVRNIIIPVPFFAIHLSSLWIQLITGVPNIVGVALAEGLKTNTIPSRNRFREVTGRDPIPVQDVLKRLAQEMRKKNS